jgi:hypothetical protein
MDQQRRLQALAREFCCHHVATTVGACEQRPRTMILNLSEGITVRAVRLLERLGVEAERITVQSFDTLPKRVPLLSMEGRRRAGAVL